MSSRALPPFRADHVGSLLRPERLKEARIRFLGPQTPSSNLGPHDDPGLRAVEDECVAEVVAMQERAGLKAATDGEFRRRSWWLDLIMGWEGFAADRTGSSKISWRNASGATQAFSELKVTGRVHWSANSPTVRAFEYLKSRARAVPKVTLPAPNMVHYFIGGSHRLDPAIYPDREQFWDDLVDAYRQELAALVKAGATYIQYDDTSIAFICDPVHRDYIRSWGEDPDALLNLYADKINATLEGLPANVTVTLHQCRGNREGSWAAEGGYDPVADVLFNRIKVQGYFLEFDSARAGGFEPLRMLPRDKVVVLGLMSSKQAALETVDALAERIREASRFAPLEQLAVSPQCGFASSVGGNPLSEADEEAKLSRLVEVARTIWGGV